MARECMECDTEANKDEGVVVGEARGGYGPICNDCWSLFLHDETVLSEREADVAALRDMSVTPSEIADVLELEKSTVYSYNIRIDDKIEAAERTVDELAGLKNR